jgi:uncharacterized damage-inducible protein DinB
MNPEDAQTLIDFNQWANRRIVAGTRSARSNDFARDLGTSFGSIRGTLVHIMWAEWIWLRRWQGQSPKQVFAAEDFADAAAIGERWKEIERGQHEFASQLTEPRLNQPVAYENLQGQRWEYTLGHMMQHVVNHSSYHRGQIVTLLRQLGASAPATDLLVFFDERARR